MSQAVSDACGRARSAAAWLAFGAVLALSALLELVKLAQNGYANTFYAAAVKSMLRSWHNFFFVASDPNGLITVDKPPLALWLQALSAKVFGFAPLSLLVPEAICAVLAVALMYWIVAPRFGRLAALASALALAVFPSFVAVSRDNGVDPLLILLMLAAAGAAITAIESGRLRWLVASAVLVGLAFNTKSLAALLCVPGMGLGYLVCAPGSLKRRLGQLVVGAVVLAAVAISWSLVVDLTPAAQRPYVGGSINNSEFQLEFGYNGFGRVGGQQGGPGDIHASLIPSQLVPLMRPGVNLPPSAAERRHLKALAHQHRAPASKPAVKSAPPVSAASTTRARGPVIPFSGTHSPLRIFASGLGDQAGWLVPLALIGMLAIAVLARGRRDRRTAVLFVLGGWFLVELATLDFSAGIVHPYYASALGPGLAAMVGGGAVAIAALLRNPAARRAPLVYAIAVLAVACTVAVQLVLMDREGYPLWWRIPLVALCAVALIAIPLLRARAGWGLGLAVAALIVAPAVYCFSVWLAPVEGTFPTAGPYRAAGWGGFDLSGYDLVPFRGLRAFLRANGATRPFTVLAQSAGQAAPLILLGVDASAEGGYGARDPALSNTRLADLVAAGKARYVMISGSYALRGGNSGETAARLVCDEVPESLWAPPGASTLDTSFLVDCRGRADALRHRYRTARAFLRAHPRYQYKL
jgi:4-amino-4-deoxy-L-arabinose transferase-like glycosyltransferase